MHFNLNYFFSQNTTGRHDSSRNRLSGHKSAQTQNTGKRNFFCEYCGSYVSIASGDVKISKCPNCGGNLTPISADDQEHTLPDLGDDRTINITNIFIWNKPAQNGIPENIRGHIRTDSEETAENEKDKKNEPSEEEVNSEERDSLFAANVMGVFFLIIMVMVLIYVVSQEDIPSDGEYHEAYAAYNGPAENPDSYDRESMYGPDTLNAFPSYFVDILGRECVWDDNYQSYHDSETGCYFYHDESTDPPEWRYWFEGISSDYSDHGWMSWSEDENCWYIDNGEGWVYLPDYYDTEWLWHIDS